MVDSERMKKLEGIRSQGVNPYPERFDKVDSVAAARAKKIDKDTVVTAGRIRGIKSMGKLTFADLRDQTGKIQISFSESVLGKEQYDLFRNHIDNGDILGVKGRLFNTEKGELTIAVSKFQLLGKALRDMPEKWHGLQDLETRWRQRYIDLIANDETRDRFMKRSQIVQAVREYLIRNGFIEVETPILQHQISGANAKPFITHHNALDIDVVLRIAPETFLKRLVVGGYERVFEIGKDFRNEDIDPQHLQEFTMLEYYAAYWNYQDNMSFIQAMVQEVVGKIYNGGLKVRYGDVELDFSGEWPVYVYRDVILRDCGIDIDKFTTYDALNAEIRKRGIEIDYEEGMGWGKLVDKLYKKVTRPKLIQPCFLVNHPTELVPLARANDQNPKRLDMFQVVVSGFEISKAYSELVDPIEQRRRFEDQAAMKRKGDEEMLDVDEDYLRAMEYGMPPVSGVGIGIDRLVALLTDAPNLRDVIFFPLMRQENIL